MLSFKRGKRGKRGGVADNAGNRAALRSPLCFPFGSRLGSHVLRLDQFGGGVNEGRGDRPIAGSVGVLNQHPVTAQLDNLEARHFITGFQDFAELDDLTNVHVVRSSCVGLDYCVTSDVSMTVRQVAA